MLPASNPSIKKEEKRTLSSSLAPITSKWNKKLKCSHFASPTAPDFQNVEAPSEGPDYNWQLMPREERQSLEK